VRRGKDGSGPDGVLVVAKPPGPTSHDVVALVRRLSGTRRVGHGGTLDPFAAGVLPLFLGRATRLVEYHAADRKQYRATICFGARSTTDDLDGELSPVEAPPPDRAAVTAALARLIGSIEQVPPAYSAIRIGGRRAYALARAGQTPALAPRTVAIDRLEVVEWDDRDPARPIAVVEVDCSPGTYVRAIARDLGEALGCGAYLCALVRTASGPFRLEDAVALEALRAELGEDPAALTRHLRPIDAGLEAMPEVELAAGEVADVAMGRFIRPAAGLPAGSAEAPLRLVGPDGELVGIGLRRGLRLVPTKVLVTAGGDAAADR
jgi:tRNA pseudouridine55 synthase